MDKPKYKAGDVVHVRLSDEEVEELNDDSARAVIEKSSIIAHIPAPEPVVRWVALSRCGGASRQLDYRPDKKNFYDASCVLRHEWLDGDTSKKPVVTVEDY